MPAQPEPDRNSREARRLESRSQICMATNGQLVCNVAEHPGDPHHWHATVTEGIVLARWRDSECLS